MQLHPDGKKIRCWRESRGWSQEDLAALAGVSLKIVRRIENGEKASREVITAVADAFDADIPASAGRGDLLVRRPQEESARTVAGWRLSFWIHLGIYFCGVLLFAAIGLSAEDRSFVLRWPLFWWTVALACHGLVAGVVKLVRTQRAIPVLRIIMPTVALLCALVFPPWAGIRAWLSPLPDTVQEQVDGAVRNGLDGIIVYVDQSGKPPAFYAAGWKDRAHRVPADPHALFKIASISKLYIAAAAAKLVGAHVLSLDDTLADRLPELAGRIENADRITLRMLLRHRSGIPNFTDMDGFDWAKRQTDPQDNLKLVLDRPADFAPDARQRYSNTNYLLVGAILDKALGYDHQLYIKREILAPLGLTHTYGSLSQVDGGDVASGHQYRVDADLKELAFETPGGSMVATAQDVGVFLRALNDGSLLDKDEQAIYSSVYEYGHTGWLPGYHSIARYHKDIDAVVVQFVSTTGGNAELTTNVVYHRIVRILRRQWRATSEHPHPSTAWASQRPQGHALDRASIGSMEVSIQASPDT